jgi:ribosome-associated protein
MIKYTIDTEYIELFKLLKATNLCDSGGEAKHFISEGLVKVDGNVETRKACKIRVGQKVQFDGKIITVD